jgi:hypothetical protein
MVLYEYDGNAIMAKAIKNKKRENFYAHFKSWSKKELSGGWDRIVMEAVIDDFAPIPPMSAKRSTTDDTTDFSAFKITLINKGIYNFENINKIIVNTRRMCTQLQCLILNQIYLLVNCFDTSELGV